MIYEAVEAETTAFFVRDHAQKRGFTAPASSNMYQNQGSLSQEERQAKVMAAKERSRCRACGQQGHWKHDPVCPKRRMTKGKGKGGFGKGKSKNKGKGFRKFEGGKPGAGTSSQNSSGGSSPAKPRVVYFSVRDELDEAEDKERFCGMVVKHESGSDPRAEGYAELNSDEKMALEVLERFLWLYNLYIYL